MQNKSEMINRIAELAEENAELKAKIKKYAAINEQETKDYAELHNENIKLNAIIDGYQPKIQALKDENYGLNQELLGYKKGVQAAEIIELKAENERLKEEVETRDNLIDHFRDEALYRATIASEYQKDKTKLEQTLQEIKKIAKDAMAKQQEYKKDFEQTLDLITKAEEE